MSSEITISVNAQDFVLNTPEWGYTVDINTALIHTPLVPRGYAVWDNGSDKDFRTVKFTWLLNAADTDTLIEIFDTESKGRSQSVTIDLGTNSGFYIGGPDWGDSGEFLVKLISINPQPVMEEPWMWFRTNAIFAIESNPSYNLPSEVDEGDLTIGTIGGLRYPPSMPESSTNYGFTTQLTYSGTPYTIDKTTVTDEHNTTLKMICNQSKAAALIDHMVNTVRDSSLNITDAGNGYLFGRSSGEGTLYSCQWLDNVISITHNRFDEFQFDLSFYKVA